MSAFNFDEALKGLREGKNLTGQNGILTPLIKQLTEAALQAEIDHHLEQPKTDSNRKNGYSKKNIQTATGCFELETPRDRNGSFEPQLIKKHQTKLTPEIDHKVLSLFSHGMARKVPLFRTSAQIVLMPPECRLPHRLDDPLTHSRAVKQE